ncbi:FLYWCH-type zinc finger-containing protein [Dirofilaria immitis]
MVNYLERARALAECSPVPSINVTPAQQRKPEQFPKVNFIVGYKRVEDIIQGNDHCMRHKIRFVDASIQLSQYRCCCNLMHAVTGTKLFLLTYVALSVVTFTFATKSAVFWSVIPFVIASLTIYALCTEKHKYLYPFLIVSSLHIILCIVVVLIIITFTAASYGTFRQIVGYYMKIRLSDTFIVVFVITSVVVFLILSIMHLWQVTVVYSCMMYFEHKHYLEREQCDPIIVKYNCSDGNEDGNLNIYHNHFPSNHKCYESCASV